MKTLTTLLFVAGMACSTVVCAGTQALGFEIGTSSVEQVKAKLAKQTRVNDAGINKFSQGPMLTTDGASYQIEGLQKVTFVFDDKNKLAAILMSMDKGRFDDVFQMLSTKYPVSSKQIPFVGNRLAKFKTSDTVISMEAPHLSFDMDVQYVRNDLLRKFLKESAEQKTQKVKAEAEQF